MSNAHDYLTTIERLGAAQFADSGLAASHAAVAHRVRAHRAVRASATSVASIGVLGGGTWGVLAGLGGSEDVQIPGTTTLPGQTSSPSPTSTSPTYAATLTFPAVSFAPNDTVDAWVADTATVLGIDEQALLDALAVAAPGDAHPEGWIKPGSYTLGPDASPGVIARSLVAQRVAQLETLGVPREQWQEVITKASIVESESPLDADMPKVARVIQNRLDQGLHLQLDSTVQYVVGDNSGAFLEPGARDTESPYNTYLHTGLPPGAIGSPSDAAIDAVLHPADGDWLYFVTVDLETGETRFATTYEDHLANTEQLRAWISESE